MSGSLVGGFEDLHVVFALEALHPRVEEALALGGANKIYGELLVDRESFTDAASLDALVVPGGWAPDKLRRSTVVLDLVRAVHARGAIVGMICHAGWVGISAGIVKGSRATGSLGIKDDLENAGATWVDEPAFRDGNLVWGRVVEDIPAWCAVLVEAIERG